MKRRWPRFSLRTLIIVVLAIALCWTMTATWGVSSVFNQLWRNVPFERSGNTLRFVITDANEDVTPEKELIVRGTAIAPFVVGLSATNRNGDTIDERATYFWFFGYVKFMGPEARSPKK